MNPPLLVGLVGVTLGQKPNGEMRREILERLLARYVPTLGKILPDR